jgi:hypothetical protein
MSVMRRPFSAFVAATYILLGAWIHSGYASPTNLYYVNYASGSDSNAGTDPSLPWQHAPGDPNAKSVPHNITLVPGDKVQFAGGVKYRSEAPFTAPTITVPAGGNPGQPIVYEGSGWGTGKAILYGGVVTKLTFTPYPAFGSNVSLSQATLPSGTALDQWTNVTIDLGDGNGAVRYAMSNTSSSPYSEFLSSGFGISYTPQTEMVCDEVGHPGSCFTDPTSNQQKGLYWVFTDTALGTFLNTLNPTTLANMVWRGSGYPNHDWNMKLTSFDGVSTAHMTVMQTNAFVPNTKPINGYIFMNNPSFIGKYGHPYKEFATDGLHIIAAIPPGTYPVAISAAPSAIRVSQSNVTIDGFVFDMYGGSYSETMLVGQGVNALGASYSNRIQDIAITNNDIKNTISRTNRAALVAYYIHGLTIKGNTVTSASFQRGFEIDGCSDLLVSHNILDRIGGNGFYTAAIDNGTISFNLLNGVYGTHTDGISVGTDLIHSSHNITITNNNVNRFETGLAGSSQPRTGSNNLTWSYNVTTEIKYYPIIDNGYWDNVNFFGNILTPTNFSASTNSVQVSYHNNVIDHFSYINTANLSKFTYNTSFKPSSTNPIKQWGVGTTNIVKTALNAPVTAALAWATTIPLHPYTLDASICAALGASNSPYSGPVGVNYTCQ